MSLIPISAGTAEWDAWIKHHRGSKTEMRMLECLANARPFYVPAQWPPDLPRADRITRKPELPAPVARPERRSIGDGEVAAVAGRLSAKAGRDEQETAEQKKRRKLFAKSEQRREAALAAARENRRPEVEDGDDFDVVRIEDPSEAVALVKAGRGQPMRVTVKAKPRHRIVALRDDRLGQLAKRGMLGRGDERDNRVVAGRRWQSLYEKAEIGGARGLDPAKDIVDGGVFASPDTDQRLAAQEVLNRLRREVGIIGDRLLVWVLGEKKTMTEVADILGADRRDLRLCRHLAEALDTIALELGIIRKASNGVRRFRDRYAAEARSLDQFDGALAVAVHRAAKLRESERSGGA
jgi:hypothetical protein